MDQKINSALISVFSKDGLDPLLDVLKANNVKVYSTGGTYEFLKDKGLELYSVESLTSYPAILGGRVKTLHPVVMGGILARRGSQIDIEEMEKYSIPEIDMVVIDLYPFEKTLASGASDEEIIEKIDIGGISLIRAAAKNFNDVLIVPSVEHYDEAAKILSSNSTTTNLEDRRKFASYAFKTSSNYDTAIANYFTGKSSSEPIVIAIEQKAELSTDTNIEEQFKQLTKSKALRYGENPHQKGVFYGDLDSCFEILNGKEVSYNNLLDIDAAINLIKDFNTTTFAIIKHNNACGLASREGLKQAYLDALSGDPISAFGGVLVCNAKIENDTAEEINKLFFEVLIAPDYSQETLDLLKSKKNRIILKVKDFEMSNPPVRTCLNGVLVQDRDIVIEKEDELRTVTTTKATSEQVQDLLFANKIVKHTKSNAIVLVKGSQLFASGVGQTSRVDALQQAIAKAKQFNFDLQGAVLASDAFFPFADCVEIAHKEGVKAFIQPGGSKNDKLSIEYCEQNDLCMLLTGIRHFKH